MKVPCQLATRDSIRAFYSDGMVVILATGSASAGDRIDIDMVRPSTTPLEFLLERCPKPGVWPEVMRPYTYSESFVLTRHPDRVRIAGTIRVHHQDGVDDVRLEPFPEDLQILRPSTAAPGEPRKATGFSSNLSFDEAFAEAVKLLGAESPPHPDALLHVRVDEVGGFFGGFAGFNDLYVRLVVESELPGRGPIEEIAPERLQRRPGDVVAEVGPGRPHRPDPEIIVEVAPPPDAMARPATGEVIVEVAPQYERGRPGGSEVIVEVAPPPDEKERPTPGDVIVEVAPNQEARPRPGDVIVEVAPDHEAQPRPGDIIVEVAPDRPRRGDGAEIVPIRPGPIVEVGPFRPDQGGGEGPIVEVGPDRPYPAGGEGPIVEVGPDRPYPAGGEGPIVEVGPDRPEEGPGKGPIVEVGPDRPEEGPGKGPIVEVGPDRPEEGPGKGPIVEVGPDRRPDERRQGPISEVAPDRPEDR